MFTLVRYEKKMLSCINERVVIYDEIPFVLLVMVKKIELRTNLD